MAPYLYALLIVAVLWNVAPLILVALLPGVPAKHKLRAIVSLASAAPKGLAILLPDLLAPIVVALALIGLKREAESLPRWARWWNNDISINGDRPEYWPLDYTGATYYSSSEPRSFRARWVWLGLRNRGSALSLTLGHTYAPGEYEDSEYWGDGATGRDHAGWTLNRRARVYQVYAVRQLGKLCLRTNVGHKIWYRDDVPRATAPV
ncbi:MAG: hypothetical protein JWP29_4708, partial [Rhodoferax sp.]|nr:hypothetical protein [Rhodoferax sp.]